MKITNKTIDQETDLLPNVIAEIVAQEAVSIGMKVELDKWDELDSEQKKELDERYKNELKAVEEYLVIHANTNFQYNAAFRKKVKGKGNAGRDYLYMFMYHWVGIHEGRKTEPNSYKKAMSNYYKAMKLYSEQSK